MAPMIDDDFIGTLSDTEDIPDELQEAAVSAPTNAKRKRDDKKQNAMKKRKTATAAVSGEDERVDADDGEMLSDFEFDNSDRTGAMGDFDGWALEGDKADDGLAGMADIDAMVARRRGTTQKVENGVESDDSEDEDGSENEDESEEAGSDEDDDEDDDEANEADEDDAQDEEQVEEVSNSKDQDAGSDSGEDEEDAAEVAKRNAFFAPEDKTVVSTTDSSFTSMSLSRPILKGLSSVGFSSPTPIQAKAIPVALEGKDIVGGAVTGSGKTAAFMIPILERLLYRPKKVATIRVAVLMPTRELALQCLAVSKKLAAFTDITFGRAIGGLNSREQEKELKLRPDIVIATPGRFIDFMRNSSSFQVDKIEIMVLDEADRMLEDGFADELNEILNTIPKSRQTMLFSATMTSRIDDLVRVGLQRPVRLMVDAQKASASGLVQEFVRLRPGREKSRLGYLMHLCSEIHTNRVIIFFRQKKEAHRVRIIFALCGLKAAELHGSMSQEQRINAIESFRSGRASFLLATDLASRGLDIKGIDTVINYEAPQTHEIYLHRVGRTARAGRTGVSCTLAAEPDRKVIKAAVKAAKQHGASVRQRTVDPKDADTWQAKCDALADEVEDILREEKEEKVLAQTERTIARAENIEKYEDEIKSRPKKTWFESEKDKLAAKKRGAEQLNGPADAKREKKGKLSNKQKKKLQDRDERREGQTWKKGKDMRGLRSLPKDTKKKKKKSTK
ncbi:atp-dependent rna helicase drs1 [Acrodontium crateriforme]|uniref:RNA helicase n=1 Tax=Acrodontium crateriforme TaxID=150365 RepID=A0AAQ3RDJ8_9PEZI|nr:atp-dependent rna helicase drs1 [Acrodontium crateriforme]